MLDPQDEQFDRRLATHLVSLYHQTEEYEETLHMVSSWGMSPRYIVGVVLILCLYRTCLPCEITLRMLVLIYTLQSLRKLVKL